MIEARIEGTPYKVNNVEVDYSLCKNKGTASFNMDITYRGDFTTFDEVEIIVNSETIFKGLIDTIGTTSFPHSLEIEAESTLLKAERTWSYEEYRANEELASSWATTFMNLAQIPAFSIDIGSDTVYEEHTWGFGTVIDFLKNICQLTNSHLYPDRNGTIQMRRLKTSGDDYTVTFYEGLEERYNTDPTRNRAVVFGLYDTATASGSNAYLVPGETRTAAISSGLIQTATKAQEVADDLMEKLNILNQIYTFTVEGVPTLSLNDWVTYTKYSGPITSLKHRYDEDGFRTSITIGEICPGFFGIDLLEIPEEPYPTMFLSTIGNGVWASEDGENWYNISGTTLNGATVPAIHWDGYYLWAITANNIYRGDGAGNWALCSVLSTFSDHVEEISVNKSDLDFRDIITDYYDSNKVYVVAHDSENDRIVTLVSFNGYLFDRLVYYR